jgi:predicted adenylyl cyclase CyaB
MPANVEIKARVGNFAHLCSLAEALSGAPGALLHQEDTFFHTSQGRLKLRTVSPEQGELIYYERHDRAGPKTSHYEIAPTYQPLRLAATLTAALGVRGVVRKQRLVFILGQTRVHLDKVEDLGTFIEFEWLMQPGQTVQEGQRVVSDLMRQFDIADQDLVPQAYIDLIAP